ncbi:hypothetical protein [Methanosarcina acetivorans]|nr:hypothetical protein [Methanosarcina acetivorans]
MKVILVTSPNKSCVKWLNEYKSEVRKHKPLDLQSLQAAVTTPAA